MDKPCRHCSHTAGFLKKFDRNTINCECESPCFDFYEYIKCMEMGFTQFMGELLKEGENG